MNFLPNSDWLLLREEPVAAYQGELLIDASSLSNVRVGLVVAVGPGKPTKKAKKSGLLHQPMGVVCGDRVAFFRWNKEHGNARAQAQVLEQFGSDHMLLRETDVLMVIEGETKVS